MNAYALTCAALALAVSGALHAATFTVTKATDTSDGACNADCSLREAIIASNAQSGADTIVVPAGTYTYALGAMPSLIESVTIRGAGADTTILDADGGSGVLIFQNATLCCQTALVSGVTITGGVAPSGAGVLINNYGTVTLRKVTVRDNTSSSAGAGILVFPDTLVVEDSTISGNTGGSGGALFINTNAGATLRNVTISGNAGTEAPAIFHGSPPGGGNLLLVNVTLTDNPPAGSAIFGNQALWNHNTTTTLKNTILAGNQDGACLQRGGFAGSIVSDDHNLDDDNTCFLTASGDLPGTDPQLEDLLDNGGPTDTHALATGSPAIDAGANVGCPAADQRGQPRPTDGNSNGSIACDIGAYEVAGTTHAQPTPTGTNVMVEPLPPSGTTNTPIVVTFPAVSESGFTNLAESSSGPTNTGFKLGNPPLVFDISTSAVYTPPVEVCIDYSTVTFTNENNMKLFHFEDGSWVNVTSSHDRANDIICALVDSFSLFGIYEDEADTEPNAFTFIDVTKVPPNRLQTSNAVTITGIDAPAAISVSGGEYQIVNVTGWTTAAGTISNGQQVRVRHVSSRQLGTTVSTTLTIGGVSDTYSSKTVPKKK